MYTNHRQRRSFGRPRFRSRGFRRPSSSIHDYISRATVKTNFVKEAPVPEIRFDSLDLPQPLQQTILRHGYTTLMPIQATGIPAIRDGKDVIGIANTGTGKTAAFLIPLIEKILKDRTYRALVITPTRELALQILEELRKFSQGMPISNSFCIGQSSIYAQIQQLRRSPHIVVGTPGRLKDLINRKILKLETFRMIVLDEVDQMLDMGFIHDVRYIVSFLPQNRQSLFFSATVSPKINTLIQSFVRNPVTISVKKQETVEHIKQDIVKVERGKTKLETLSMLLRKEEFKKVLVFGRTKRGVDNVSRELFQRGFKVTAIHGNKPQHKRQQAIRMFKEDVVRVLVATDVAARGLDIANISHVINFDIPTTYEDYIHRIGRTGRANKAGVALTISE